MPYNKCSPIWRLERCIEMSYGAMQIAPLTLTARTFCQFSPRSISTTIYCYHFQYTVPTVNSDTNWPSGASRRLSIASIAMHDLKQLSG